MARHERVVMIAAEGRDHGKAFRIREMPAEQAEWWAIRALSLLGGAGADLPDGTVEAGIAGLASVEATKGLASALTVVGLRTLPGITSPEALAGLKALLDEMMTCVSYVPPTRGGVALPDQSLAGGDFAQIEEIATRLKLRADVLELHLGFSLAGAVSTSGTTPSPVPA